MIPSHVAVIMDGNGRWAKAHGENKLFGHNAGMLAMKEIIKKADALGVGFLTVYAFSTENWKRSTEEIGGIFKLLVKFVASELREMNDANVKVTILGDTSKLPEDAKRSVEEAIETTKGNTGLRFNIALNYGARDEITRAVKEIVKSGVSESDVTEEMISRALYTGAEGIPDPDLIIRTSGEMRLSNFLLWQAAYSEFAFTDTLWPDFTPEEFEKIVLSYGERERRYGGR